MIKADCPACIDKNCHWCGKSCTGLYCDECNDMEKQINQIVEDRGWKY